MRTNLGQSRWALTIISALTFILVPALWPVHGQATTSVFGVIGDYGSNGPSELAVANLVKSWSPEFIVTVGDNNYPDGEAATIDANIGQYYHDYIFPYLGAYGAGATTNKFYPALGNHDWDSATGAQPYLDYFALPGNERYYDFVLGSVHFFILDSDLDEPDGRTSGSVQAAWLQSQMTASTTAWQLVMLHHSPYSSGVDDGSNPDLQWSYSAWGADGVVSGHNHNYERIDVAGVPYFVNGTSGDFTDGFGTPVPGSQVRYSAEHGAMRVEASASQITFQFINVDGVVIDTLDLFASGVETPTPTATVTRTPTITQTPTHTSTATTTLMPTVTSTPTPTRTATPSPTDTASPLPSSTSTLTLITTSTLTPSPSQSSTATRTPTSTPTLTPTPTPRVLYLPLLLRAGPPG